MLRRWFVDDKAGQDGYHWENNRLVCEWLQGQKANKLSSVNKQLAMLRKEAAVRQIQAAIGVRKIKIKLF